MSLLQLQHIQKSFGATQVLKNIDLEIKSGEHVAITGSSGGGKSTLLGILGLLEFPDSGVYLLEGRPVQQLPDREQSKLRNHMFGFVFQQFHLLPQMHALDNVAHPLALAGVPLRERRERAWQQLEKLGLSHRVQHHPAQLSGGEQQRVAIARALINNPRVILADEPTGNLPQSLWQEMLDVFDRLHSEGHTLVVVTHDPLVAGRAERQVLLRDGSVVSEQGLPIPR